MGGHLKHEFAYRFRTGGIQRGEVRLVGEDGSKMDDSRYFAIEVDRGIPVAIVKPQRHKIPYLEDTFYLEPARLLARQIERLGNRLHGTHCGRLAVGAVGEVQSPLLRESARPQ